MNAKVIVELHIKNACDESLFGKDKEFKSFAAVIRWLIKQEGLFGVVEDKHKILAIEQE